MQQDEAFNLFKMGKNIFLTSAAGSGKTYLLNQYISHMLKENTSINSIAETRGLTLEAVITHIEKLKGLKLLDDAFIETLKNPILKKTLIVSLLNFSFLKMVN